MSDAIEGEFVERALAVREEMAADPAPRRMMTLDEIRSMGAVFYASGMFQDVKSEAQAIVKIVAGQELGIGPMSAMTQIQIVEGKPTLTAPAIGGRIKSSGRYDYRVLEHSNEVCHIRFFDRGIPVGESRFDMADARQAGLAGKNTWQKYPRNMLFARAMTNGARWYCADVFSGAIYTAEELGGGDAPALAPPVAAVTAEPKPDAAVEKKREVVSRATLLGVVPSDLSYEAAVEHLKAWTKERGATRVSDALDAYEAEEKTLQGFADDLRAAEESVAQEPPLTPIAQVDATMQMHAEAKKAAKKPTDMQRIKAMAAHNRLGHDDDMRHDYYEQQYGVRSFSDLTRDQASELIDMLERNAQGVS